MFFNGARAGYLLACRTRGRTTTCLVPQGPCRRNRITAVAEGGALVLFRGGGLLEVSTAVTTANRQAARGLPRRNISATRSGSSDSLWVLRHGPLILSERGKISRARRAGSRADENQFFARTRGAARQGQYTTGTARNRTGASANKEPGDHRLTKTRSRRVRSSWYGCSRLAGSPKIGIQMRAVFRRGDAQNNAGEGSELGPRPRSTKFAQRGGWTDCSRAVGRRARFGGGSEVRCGAQGGGGIGRRGRGVH